MRHRADVRRGHLGGGKDSRRIGRLQGVGSWHFWGRAWPAFARVKSLTETEFPDPHSRRLPLRYYGRDRMATFGSRTTAATRSGGSPRRSRHQVRRAHGTPVGIATGPDGNLWFGATAPDRAHHPAGVITDSPYPGPSAPPDHGRPGRQPLVHRASGNKIGRITPAGVVTSSRSHAGSARDRGGPGRNLWFTETTATRSGGSPRPASSRVPDPHGRSEPGGIAAGPGRQPLVHRDAARSGGSPRRG